MSQRIASTRWFIGGACGALGLLSLCVSAVEVIVHPNVTATALTVSTARSTFGMRQNKWPDGTPVRVFVLADAHPLHNAFCKEVLDIFPYQLRQSWDRQVYSGIGQAPTELFSEEQMIERVSATLGAIGYVKKVSDHDAVRIITVH